MLKYIDATFDEIANANFQLYAKNPVITAFGVSPIIADPSVIAPKESHDGKWHLFAHGLLGIYSFSSNDGLTWENQGRVLPRGMRPDCSLIDGTYYLYYERTQTLLGKALSFLGGKWRSRIFLSTSKDLKDWTEPKLIINNDREYTVDERGISISNPFLTKIGDKYRLYYSAGQTYIPDCGFCEPTHISYAESDSLTGGFLTRETPIISPDEDSEYLNLCSGCLKVYKLKDCYLGLQNGIYRKGDKSHSTIMMLRSDDGVNFEFVKALLEPQETNDRIKGWMKQYVYACNLVKVEDEFRLYFNARNTSSNLTGREHIGVFIAKKA